MSETPSHDSGHDEAPVPGESWANAALAIFISVFFAAGIYSASHGYVAHQEEESGAEHPAKGEGSHGAAPAAPSHEEK